MVLNRYTGGAEHYVKVPLSLNYCHCSSDVYRSDFVSGAQAEETRRFDMHACQASFAGVTSDTGWTHLPGNRIIHTERDSCMI